MPIPKAPPGEEYAYDFQYAIFLAENEKIYSFLDRYLYEPVADPIRESDELYLSAEDMKRLYAPYLQVCTSPEISVTYGTVNHPPKTVILSEDMCRWKERQLYLPLLRLMGQEYEKPCIVKNFAVIVAIDGTRPPEEVFPSPMAVKPMRNRLEGKVFGEQDYTVWDQQANRLLPYRMYIPSTYSTQRPQKTAVCFHGGDANPDYMFMHTHNEIEEYAEDRGYILLALCSYRKFTFFGGSRLPTGSDRTWEGDENPCGLTEEELEWCTIAEQSVKLQLDDAAGRYNLDRGAMVALGNSGGSLGIFRQVAQAGGPLFRGAVCSGGMPNIRAVEPQKLRESKTRFLLLVSSEDAFDAQYALHTGWPYLREHGVDTRCQVVGGGSHLLGWTHGLKKIFDFFDKVLEGDHKDE